MKHLNIQSLTILLFIIPLSFIAGIAVTEFFVFFCTIFFLIFNKDKFLFINQKVIFLFLFFYNYLKEIEHNLIDPAMLQKEKNFDLLKYPLLCED